MLEPTDRPRVPAPAIDPVTMRRMLLHEAQVHATPGRELRDLGDAILLHDPLEHEPFWNRLEAIRWPEDPSAFDRRLTESLVLFASIGRQPHVWPAPVHDTPVDLVARLLANGFQDVGPGDVMVRVDLGPARLASALALPRGVSIQRLGNLGGSAALAAATDVVTVLLDAFDVDEDRRAGVEKETVISLGHPSFTHYLVRLDGEPAAVARRATFDGLSYLSSIGTCGWARQRGFGRLVTALATLDAAETGSDWTYLGVFADNPGAIALYERLGFARVGESCPDLLLV
jgi:ribosomal protein S18 acetylase RimI-like enzyme